MRAHLEWMKRWAAENQPQGPGPQGRERQLHGSARKSQAPAKQTILVRWPPAGPHMSQAMLKHGLSGIPQASLHHRWAPEPTPPDSSGDGASAADLMISCQWVLFLHHANQDHECLKESSWSSGTLSLCCIPHSPGNTANFEAFCKPAATVHLKTERNPSPSTRGGH